MKKLKKRQIIILAVAALFVLYAIYELLIAGPAAKKAKTEAQPVEIESFVNTLSNDLMKYKAGGVTPILRKERKRTGAKVRFGRGTSYREFVGKRRRRRCGRKIIYSGYVDTGRKKMAIINGWEYEAGESLDIEGYVLKSVTPLSVLIVNRKTGSELYIPIQE